MTSCRRAAHQPPVLGLGDPIPGVLPLAARKRRDAIDLAVESVEVMGELVQHHVAAVRLVAAGLKNVLPREHDRTVIPRFADHTRTSRTVPVLPELRRVNVDAGIENDRLHPIEVIRFVEPQDHHGRLARDGHLHFVADREVASAAPVFLGHQHAHHRLHRFLSGRIEV